MRRIFLTIVAMVLATIGARAEAQQSWVQIEAFPSLAEAEQSARGYAEILRDVNGLRLGSGWYAVAIGPLDPEAASQRLRTLRTDGAIPRDSFIVTSDVYSEQFYPVGSTALAETAGDGAISTEDLSDALAEGDTDGTIQTSELDAPAQPDADQTAEAPAPEQTQPEQIVIAEPEPEETRQEALQSEAQLGRDERAELQVALRWFGFYNGAIDAAFGPGTRGSMAEYQRSEGLEATGVLTSRQRAQLLSDYDAVFSELGLRVVRDTRAGIEMQLPMGLVDFDRYDPPFAHYPSEDDNGVRVLLISQTGSESTLLGLYDIMQTLEIVPVEGERNRTRDSFTLTGQNARISSHTYAQLGNGHVKGFTLIWPNGFRDERIREYVLNEMQASFTALPDAVLPDVVGDGQMEQRIDLLSGLRIRRPERTRSGFYVDARGSVLTTTEAVDGCERVTIEEAYDATVAARDDALGLALLRPNTQLSPIDYARFQAAVPRLQSEIAVAGYPYDGVLSAPTLTFGTLEDVRGLQGQDNVKRLALMARPGNAGGPVFDTTGAVLGMLLPEQDGTGQVLPEDVTFAADATAIGGFLSQAGFSPSASDKSASLAPEDLTRIAGDMTVLVSCWN
ncbi:trypsin-like peptidase domain-containing protein [Anianabacter salinae]|uniref:trypsin-like peptidase domain-containing protein n=1 Tax=Anianabacter salinae TaxID=2851023 RepID=UPI00225E6E84|nr:trypsin-like peptidase domain-containing protein [Anianabacter salinae]MBV0913983.1 trypsin-like peptidase domain-containing protein [Anianabacter salinae]